MWIGSGPPADSPSQDLDDSTLPNRQASTASRAARAALVAVQVVLAAPPQPELHIVGPNCTTTCGLYTFTSTSTDPDDDIADDRLGHRGHGRRAGAPSRRPSRPPGTRTINMTATDTDAGDGTVDRIPAAPQTVNVGNGGSPNAAFSPSRQPGRSRTPASRSTPPARPAPGGGSIAKYEWDLDGNGTLRDRHRRHAVGDDAATPTAGDHAVSLRVTDNCGATDTDDGDVVVNNHRPPAVLHGHAATRRRDRRAGHLQRRRLERPRRLDRQVRVGPRRRRHVRDRHRHRRHDDQRTRSHGGRRYRQAAGSPTTTARPASPSTTSRVNAKPAPNFTYRPRPRWSASRSPSTAPPRPTPTARSRATSGTSTATAASRRHRRATRRTPTTPPARSTSSCA